MATEDSIRQQEIEFLLTCLLDTEEPDVRSAVVERLLNRFSFGDHPARYVELVVDPASRAALRSRYLGALNEATLRRDLQNLVQGVAADVDLESGAYLIARLSDDPDLNFNSFREQLDALARPLRDRLPGVSAEGAAAELEAFRTYVFEELGFRGNSENYYEPENSYLTAVLARKTGIPVSLSVLCLLLARRVGLGLSGVNLPGHFILKFQSGAYTMYMDAFNEGNLLTENDCLNFLSRQGLEPSLSYLSRATALTILKRMYRNLINYHSATGNARTEKLLRQHFSILENCSIAS
ncbi:MAG: transglutaminase-like domain-containing protein [Leptospirales bacterium]|nr:transglutaminase-like domain-containing protein [Leptospirales bacterium]